MAPKQLMHMLGVYSSLLWEIDVISEDFDSMEYKKMPCLSFFIGTSKQALW